MKILSCPFLKKNKSVQHSRCRRLKLQNGAEGRKTQNKTPRNTSPGVFMFAKADAKLLGNQARAAVTMSYQTVGYHGFPERPADYSPGDVHRFEKSGSFIGDVCVKHERGHEHYEQEYQRYEYYAYYRNSQKDNQWISVSRARVCS